MSREKQIEEMARILNPDSCFEGDITACRKMEDCDICKATKLYNAGCHKQEWISVDERLPENDYGKHWKERRYYLVMTEPSGLMRVARFGYKDFPWWIDSHDTVLTSANYNKVTHWMPLPEAPKMKGGAE
jgi:hypothetical protein